MPDVRYSSLSPAVVAARARARRDRYRGLAPLPRLLGGLKTMSQPDGTWHGWLARIIVGRQYIHEASVRFADRATVDLALQHAQARRGLIRGVRVLPSLSLGTVTA